jgi:hypothetical protein
MAITSALRISGTQQNRAIGAFKDTGTVKKSVVKLGFVPRHVKLIDATNRISYEWYEGMAADSAIKQAANGDTTLETSNGITVGALNTGTVDTWTVYEHTLQTVGTPSVASAEDTDMSRLNLAQEVITGFNAPAAILTSSGQFYFIAED